MPKMILHAKRIPSGIWLALLMFVGEGFVDLVRHPSTARVVVFAFAVLLAWFLVRASRVAWVLVVVSSVSQLITPFVTGGSLWIVALAAIRIGFLLAPSSRTFIWSSYKRHTSEPPDYESEFFSGTRAAAAITKAPVIVSAIVTSLGVAIKEVVKKKACENKFLIRLAIGVVVLMFALTPLNNLRHDFGDNSVIVAIAWRVAWISFNLLLLSLIVLVVVRVYVRVTGHTDESSSDPSSHSSW